MINATTLSSFSLLGLNDLTTKQRVIVFSFTLLCYCAIFLVNGALIFIILLDEKLHEPMYIFLCNLCINSLYGTTGFYPKFLYDLLTDSHVISYIGCLLQIFVIYSYAATDFSILALMAYDRYVAICRPLEYHAVMTKHRIVLLQCLSRLVPLFCHVVILVMTSRLKLCGLHIEKIYCENWSILKLSCDSITTNNIMGFIFISFYFGHDLFIMFSYAYLVKSAINSREGRRKFMQTCVPHLLCLINVSAALLFDLMYARYGSASVPQTVKNFMAVYFLILPPLFNPIIYGFKLTKVRNSLLSLCAYTKQGLG